MQAIIRQTPEERAMPKTSVQTTVRVDPEAYAAMQRLAQKAGLSINAWLVQAIREKVERDRRRDR